MNRLKDHFKFRAKKIARYFSLLILALFLLALLPEQYTTLLTKHDGWTINGPVSSEVPVASFPLQFRQIRKSSVDSPGGVVFRTWSPKNGIEPLRISSSSFIPAPYMSVVITGTNRTAQGLVSAVIKCEENNKEIEVFRGGVNVNVAESIVVTPENWCSGTARLKFISNEEQVNVGAGSIYEISYLSYLKSTYLGLFPYYVISLVVIYLVMLSGASLALRYGWTVELLPVAFISLGAVALTAFYISSAATMFRGGWLGAVILLGLAIYSLALSGRESRKQAVAELRPYAMAWMIASFVYFTILSLATNGLGHWDPNYRFWPAIWSSDNELQWLIAVAVRHSRDLSDLFGGNWLPTDRPPLMAGVYLLLIDLFEILQVGNDGEYLTGKAFNAAAVILNSSWVPACLWLLTLLRRTIKGYEQALILIFIGCMPFVLFNTIYGWPKAFGAAYALVGFGLAWLARETTNYQTQRLFVLMFFMVSALSVMAHASTALFLAPVGLIFLWWVGSAQKSNILFGFFIALSILLSWIIYKQIVLPSSEPVIKYALTGDYGFGDREKPLWEMLSERYRSFGFWEWLNIKEIMLVQAFLPIDHQVTQVHLNSDSGATALDKLRAWDFMMLSKGNILMPVFVVISVLTMFWCASKNRKAKLENDAPFLFLIIVSLTAWILLVVVFLVPVIIHVWPQAALFGLALGGAVIIYTRYPKFFMVALITQLGYTSIVWICSPLYSSLRIDFGAAVVLLLLIAGFVIYGFKMSKANSYEKNQ